MNQLIHDIRRWFQPRDNLECRRMLMVALLAGVFFTCLGLAMAHLSLKPRPVITDVRVLEARPYARDTLTADVSWVEGTASTYDLTLWKESEDFHVRLRLELRIPIEDLKPQGTIDGMIFLPRRTDGVIQSGGLIFPAPPSTEQRGSN